jgi:SpoVK/Ycf46/Vps4 family AAA+-type ATPase
VKADLIEKLIHAHRSGVEDEFRNAVTILAADEEKKGNVRLSNQIRDAYFGKNADSTLVSNLGKRPKKDEASRSAQSVGSSASPSPRDKDSMLELYETVHPTTSLSEVILPKNQKILIEQILQENEKNEKLIKHRLPPANRLLLCGPPGCGKTMTAYAIASELGLPMAYVRLDGLVSSYLGQTSVNLRKVFDSVKGMKIVLFLDEFDAIAKKRDDENEMGELKRVVTALLQNFDNMPTNVFLIAATNHEHLLDPAIWRRFNYVINLSYPDGEQRAELIKRWLDEFSVEYTLKMELLTLITVDRSTAQLKELVMAAAKRFVTTEQPIVMDDMVELLIQQLTNNANSADVVHVASTLHDKGVSIRTLAKALGMKHNTLSYQLKKTDKESDGGDGQ